MTLDLFSRLLPVSPTKHGELTIVRDGWLIACSNSILYKKIKTLKDVKRCRLGSHTKKYANKVGNEGIYEGPSLHASSSHRCPYLRGRGFFIKWGFTVYQSYA